MVSTRSDRLFTPQKVPTRNDDTPTSANTSDVPTHG